MRTSNLRQLATPRRTAKGLTLLLGSASLATSLLFLGCGNEAEQEKKIADVQRQADERVAKAERDCKEKIASLEKQIESVKAEAATASAQAKAQVDDAITKAQASTEEAAKAAETALGKAQQAYKLEGRTRLTDLNKEFSEIATKGSRTPPKDKAAWDKALKDVATHQKEINKDLAAFDKATLETLAATKGKLDKDVALMKNSLKLLRARLPKA